VRAAVSRIDRTRTVAAVERVLKTATPGYGRRTEDDCPGGVSCACHRWNRGGSDRFTYWADLADPLGELEGER
jgi:hypothetical protein